jgi:hypothetical protein
MKETAAERTSVQRIKGKVFPIPAFIVNTAIFHQFQP